MLMKPDRIDIRKSSRKGKKYVARFQYPSGRKKTTHFGGRGYSDYTIHKDKNRKQLYLNRHRKRENWNDPTTAGSLSRYLLWNKPTLNSSFEDYKKRFGLSGSIKPKSYYRNIQGKHFLGSNKQFDKSQARLIAKHIRDKGINARVIPTKNGHRIYVHRKYNFPILPSDEVNRRLGELGPSESDITIGKNLRKDQPKWWKPMKYDAAQNLRDIQMVSEYGITTDDVVDSLAYGIFNYYDNGQYIAEYLQDELELFDNMGMSKWVDADGKKIDLGELRSLYEDSDGRSKLMGWLGSLSNKELAQIYRANQAINELTEMSEYLGQTGEVGDALMGGWTVPSIKYRRKQLKEYDTVEIMQLQAKQAETRKRQANRITNQIAQKDKRGFFGELEETDLFSKVALNDVDASLEEDLITLPIKTMRIWQSNNPKNEGQLLAYSFPRRVVEIANEDIKKYRNGEQVENSSEMFFFSRLGGMYSAIENDAFRTFDKTDVDTRKATGFDYLVQIGLDQTDEFKEEWIYNTLPEELREYEGDELDNPVIESLDVGVFSTTTGELVGYHSPSRNLGASRSALDNRKGIKSVSDLGFESPEEQVAAVLSPSYAKYYSEELFGNDIIDAVYWRGQKIMDSTDLEEIQNMGAFADEDEIVNPQNVLDQYEDDLYAYIIIGRPDLISEVLTPQEARAFLPRKDLDKAYKKDRLESFLTEASMLIGQEGQEENEEFWEDVMVAQYDPDEFKKKYGYTVDEMLDDMTEDFQFDERLDSAQSNVENTLEWGDLTTENKTISVRGNEYDDIFEYYGRDEGKEALYKLAEFDTERGEFAEQKDRYGSF